MGSCVAWAIRKPYTREAGLDPVFRRAQAATAKSIIEVPGEKAGRPKSTALAAVMSPTLSLRQSVLKGGVYLFARQVLTAGLKVIGVFMITRVIGPEKYGTYVAASGICAYAVSIGQAGVGVFLLRHAGDLSETHYGTAYAILSLTATGLIGGLAVATPWLGHWIAVPDVPTVLGAMLLAVPFQLLAVPATVQLERAFNYRSVAASELLGVFAFYGVAIPLAWTGRGALSLAFGWIVQQVGTCLLAHLWARRRPRFRWNGPVAREIVVYALGYSLSGWIWQLRSLVNALVVGHFLGANAVGIVGMTSGLLDMLGVIKTISLRLSIVALGRIQADKEKLLEAVNVGMRLQTLSVGTMMLGFAWFGRIIVPVLFGPRWLPVMDVYPYLALCYLVNAQSNMHSATLSVLGRNIQDAVFTTSYAMLFAGAAIVLVPMLGMIGYGAAETVALVSYLILHVYTARAIGSPNYALPAIWLCGAAIGLFWRQIGVGAIAAPFAVLLLPASLREIARLYAMFAFAPRRAAQAA